MAQNWSKPFYNSKTWKKCRKAYIASVHGLCERCSKAGREYVPGLILHHNIHLTPDNINNPAIALSHEHLEYLCLDCHNVEHGKAKQVLREGLFFDGNGDVRSETS